MKRQRGRNRRSSGGQNNNINRHFESNGPDVKIRGSAQQVLDKYLQYAREAQTNGDRVKSEAYFQYAEHYQRTLAMMQANQKPKRDRDDQRNRDNDSRDNDTSDSDEAEVVTASSGGDNQPNGEAKADPLRVIGEDQSGDQRGSEQAASGEHAGDGDAKPKKPRRRNYKKRSDDGEAAADTPDEADGVMKTLSRGRKPSKPKDDSGDAGDTPETAAEAAAE